MIQIAFLPSNYVQLGKHSKSYLHKQPIDKLRAFHPITLQLVDNLRQMDFFFNPVKYISEKRVVNSMRRDKNDVTTEISVKLIISKVKQRIYCFENII